MKLKHIYFLGLIALLNVMPVHAQSLDSRPSALATIEEAVKNNQAILESDNEDGNLIETQIKYEDGTDAKIFPISLSQTNNVISLEFGYPYLGFALGKNSDRRTLHLDHSGNLTWVGSKDQKEYPFVATNTIMKDKLKEMATCMCGMSPIQIIQNWKSSLTHSENSQ
jgi:hypothetical protein